MDPIQADILTRIYHCKCLENSAISSSNYTPIPDPEYPATPCSRFGQAAMALSAATVAQTSHLFTDEAPLACLCSFLQLLRRDLRHWPLVASRVTELVAI